MGNNEFIANKNGIKQLCSVNTFYPETLTKR